MDAAANQLDGGLMHQSETDQSKQYLTFTLSDDDYGVEILKVRELRAWEPVRMLPGTPNYLLGVLNLRGDITPIIDLRIRFGLEPVVLGAMTVVVVFALKSGGKNRQMGIVADTVSDVLTLCADDIKVSPDLGGSIDTDYCLGMYVDPPDGKVVILLDVDHLLDTRELTVIDGAL